MAVKRSVSVESNVQFLFVLINWRDVAFVAVFPTMVSVL